jgi:hypothetical protein
MQTVRISSDHPPKEDQTGIMRSKYVNTVKAMGLSTACEYESRLKNLTGLSVYYINQYR